LSITSISGGGNHNVNVYGNGTVIAGNGNDSVNITGAGNVVIGNGRDTISIGGSGTVSAGSGNDRISILQSGNISVGGGNDTLSLHGTGRITEIGLSGHDTINLGSGNDTIVVQGYATVHSGASNGYGAGGATIYGGSLVINHQASGITQDVALAGKMTLMGGTSLTEFVAGSGSTVMKGGSGHDLFIAGSGHDTMTGAGSHNVFEFLSSNAGGQHVITNFVSGDTLNVEGHSLTWLISHHDVTSHNGNTYISVDNGKTTIELQGVTQPSTLAHPPGTPPDLTIREGFHGDRF